MRRRVLGAAMLMAAALPACGSGDGADSTAAPAVTTAASGEDASPPTSRVSTRATIVGEPTGSTSPPSSSAPSATFADTAVRVDLVEIGDRILTPEAFSGGFERVLVKPVEGYTNAIVRLTARVPDGAPQAYLSVDSFTDPAGAEPAANY